ncbi:MAG: response regulator transcription factor [Planctomycetaceae bacterium]|nr:response regulator transcription factor [Planctomycetaceae bacterium]
MSVTLTQPNSRTGTKPAQILIVDDHPIVREGYEQMISRHADLEVCAVAADTMDALRLCERAEPDLAIIDLSLKGGSGLELCKQVKSRFPRITTLVISMHDEQLYAERALRAGALGYVNKADSTRHLINAIRHVLKGKLFLSEAMNDRLLNRMVGHEGRPEMSAIESLSDRELQVFELLGEGKTVRDIAAQLKLSPKTIESYRENLKTKLGIAGGTQLLRHAVQWVLENR